MHLRNSSRLGKRLLTAGTLLAMLATVPDRLLAAPSEEPGSASRAPAKHWAGDSEAIRRWLDFCKDCGSRYEIALLGQPNAEIRLLPEPIFRHGISGHPGGFSVAFGPVLLWVDRQQRPVLIADLFVYADSASSQRVMLHEFHSLAAGPLSVALKEEKPWKWETKGAGVQWQPLPKAPAPADSAAARLRQMREICQRFQGQGIDHKHSRWEYRLLPRPVYRYEPQDAAPVLDGALFVFCEGNDPELVLLIEARPTSTGNRWYYGFASLAGWAVHVQLDGVEVWSQPLPVGADPPGAVHFSNRCVAVKLPEEAQGAKQPSGSVVPSASPVGAAR